MDLLLKLDFLDLISSLTSIGINIPPPKQHHVLKCRVVFVLNKLFKTNSSEKHNILLLRPEILHVAEPIKWKHNLQCEAQDQNV